MRFEHRLSKLEQVKETIPYATCRYRLRRCNRWRASELRGGWRHCRRDLDAGGHCAHVNRAQRGRLVGALVGAFCPPCCRPPTPSICRVALQSLDARLLPLR